MPRTAEQFEKIRESKRRRIMETALELFANEGYHNTSISRIAEKAGISKGLMYNYFESKESLVSTILDEGIQTLAGLFDPNRDGVLTEEEFDYYVEKSFDILTANITYWKLYFSILMQAEIYAMIRETYTTVIEGSMRMLVDYYERRGVDDPYAEAVLFGAVMDGISMNYLFNPSMFPLDKIKHMIVERFGHK